MATAELIDTKPMRVAVTLPKPLTPEQLEDIEISRQQFAAGLGIPHEEVMREFDAMYWASCISVDL